MKYLVVAFVLFVTACGISQTQLPLNTETPIPSTSSPQIIEVTRVVRVEQTLVVTATPIPLLAQECFDTAITQHDLNGCAALERELAKAELERTISQIKFSPEENRIFDKLQAEWQKQVENDCEFFYGQILTDSHGNLHYKWGSMAPMQRSFCQAEHYKQRIEYLRFAYLNPGWLKILEFWNRLFYE